MLPTGMGYAHLNVLFFEKGWLNGWSEAVYTSLLYNEKIRSINTHFSPGAALGIACW